MTVQGITNQFSTVFSLDRLLEDIPEMATEELSDIEETYQSYKKELNQELKTTDRVWLEFHAGQGEQFGKAAKSMLYRVVNSSIGCPQNSVAAANAITILKVMKVSFSCLDLRRIQIPHADLSGAILDRADLSGANLENTDLRYASLNGTNMPKATLKNIKLDLPGVLIHEDQVLSSIVSPDKKYLVSEDARYIYFWDLQSRVCRKKIGRPYEQERMYSESSKIFTPCGKFLFIFDSEQYATIYSVDSFEWIKKIKISNEIGTKIYFCFSLDGKHLITYGLVNSKTQLKLWELQKTEEDLLNISLKKDEIIPFEISSIFFSKKFPVFYCLKEYQEYSPDNVGLSIWNIEKFSEIASKPEIAIVSYSGGEDFTYACEFFSLEGLDSGKNNEELLFIACANSIYSVTIVKKNEQIWAEESIQVTKIVTEDDIIFNMHILEGSHELIYVSNNTICLYSIKNNQLIGKFKLIDTNFRKLPVSHDGREMYINNLNKVLVHPIDALRDSLYPFYEIDSNSFSFSSDMRSFISYSNGLMQSYELETGNLQKTKSFPKLKSHLLNKCGGDFSIVLSQDTKQILFTGDFHQGVGTKLSNFLVIMNTENGKVLLEDCGNDRTSALSSNFEYLVHVYPDQKLLSVYKYIHSFRCIGEFNTENYVGFAAIKLTLAVNFTNKPRLAFFSLKFTIVVFFFNFNNEILKQNLSPKELPIDVREVLELLFTENDTKLIVACRKKFIIWDIEHDLQESYDIRANCVAITCDRSLLVYYGEGINQESVNHQLCLWDITQKKSLIVQTLSLPITKLQISPDNRYIIGTVENGSIYIWKIINNTFRLLWRTSHNLQTQGLILGDNNLEKDLEEDLISRMGALKL